MQNAYSMLKISSTERIFAGKYLQHWVQLRYQSTFAPCCAFYNLKVLADQL